MANWELFILITAAVIVFITFYVHLTREIINPNAKAAARATRHILSRFGFPRGFKVLSNVTLKNGDKETTIENMLIGYFGILLVRTLGARGEYYGTLDSESWTMTDKNKKCDIENPIKLLEREEAALRSVFAKNKVYNVSIERVVYISSRSKKTAVYLTHNGEILLGGKLSGYLEKSKFEKDTGLDVKKVVDVVNCVHTV